MPPECEADARVAADCGAKLQHDLQDLFGELAGIADDVFAGLSGFDFSLLPQEASFCSAECEQFLQSFNCTTNASGAGDFLAIKYGRSVRRWPPRGGALPASAHGGGGGTTNLPPRRQMIPAAVDSLCSTVGTGTGAVDEADNCTASFEAALAHATDCATTGASRGWQKRGACRCGEAAPSTSDAARSPCAPPRPPRPLRPQPSPPT